MRGLASVVPDSGFSVSPIVAEAAGMAAVKSKTAITAAGKILLAFMRPKIKEGLPFLSGYMRSGPEGIRGQK
jgi:hypothetical protein